MHKNVQKLYAKLRRIMRKNVQILMIIYVQNLYVNGAKFVCKTAQNLCVKLCRTMCKTVQNCVTLSDMAHVKYFLMHYCVHIISGET
jgi:hypothetical protein